MSGEPSPPPSPLPHFFHVSPFYPEVTEDGKIDTVQFLETSKAFIKIYDLLGTAFYVVKKDMAGNIEKLYKTYNKSPEKYKFLNDLIYLEKEDPTIFAVDALLWLKRALEFTVIFIKGLCEEYKKGITTDRLDHLATDAYNKTLKCYHSWLVQNVFKLPSSDGGSLIATTSEKGQQAPAEKSASLGHHVSWKQYD
ncbi:glycolipid transfer protein-like isoform X3 [Portunus trituberculatus]|uniref:glycolipid transfer protein-like isoform X3 n=1 Tax=Portunus trituberculatus TaxID=210409 RepID=UPI001E1CFD5F|nr:glycolipid transfer protein-like isoform X3 [Portunus trituberculatus]